MSESGSARLGLMARVDLGSSAEELTRAWRAAPEAQRSDFLDDLLMEALLTDALARKRRTWLHSRRAWWAAAAAAALLVIAGAMGWRLWSQTRYPRPELTGDCVVTTPDGSVVGAADIRRGDRLDPHLLQLFLNSTPPHHSQFQQFPQFFLADLTVRVDQFN